MMIKYKLDFSITENFIQDNLSRLNILSDFILQTILQKKGFFYTYLPDGLSKSQIHDFLFGGKTKNNRKYISKLLHNYMSSNKSICIFDDINSNPTELDDEFISENNVYIYINEVYYIINNKESSESILKYLNYSSSIWHSLAVFFKKPIKIPEKPALSLENLRFISKNATLILLEAYDGESYIFWEKTR